MSEDQRKDAQSGSGARKDGSSGDAAGNRAGSSSDSAADAARASTPDKTAPAASDGASSSQDSPAKPADRTTANAASAASDKPQKTGGSDKHTSAGSRAKPAASSTRATRSDSSAAAGGDGKSGPTNRTTTPARGGSGGGGAVVVAVIALIVALVAVAGAGWLWYRGEQRLAAYDSRLNTVEQGLESNVQDVVMPRLSKFDNRLSSLSQQTSRNEKTLSSVREDVTAAQSRMAGLAERLDSSGNRWEMRQIESLLQAANQRLQLYDDPQGARNALQLANQAIGRMSDPRLFKVRQAIVNEVAALQALPDPDIEGLSLSLAAMVEQVPKLPLAADVPAEYQSQSNAESSSAAGGGIDSIDFSQGWSHFVDSVQEALSGMLTIRRSDGTQRALLPPDQVFFLSQNLQLQLRTARLALLERDTQSYRDSLAAAQSWLKDYYATDSSAVSKLIEQLDQMRNVKLDWDPPDISASLTQLRQLMARGGNSNENANGQSADAASADNGGGADEGSP